MHRLLTTDSQYFDTSCKQPNHIIVDIKDIRTTVLFHIVNT